MNKTLILSTAYAINLMFFSFLIIICTIFGHSSLAAEIGLVFSVASSMNLLFSYNIKNLVLLDNNQRFALKVFSFRVFSGLIVITFLFLILFFYKPNFFSNKIIITIVVIIIQQSLIEIVLFLNEIKKNLKIFKYYNLLYIFNICLISLNIFFLNNKYLKEILYLVAFMNFLILFFFVDFKIFFKIKLFKIINPVLKLFELSSSITIVLSIFFWRFFIYMNYEKEISGILFSSFAIGSFSSTLFNFVIGPSVIKKKKEINLYTKIYLIIILFLLMILLFFYKLNYFYVNLSYLKSFFIEATFYSVFGSIFMLIAAICRLYYFEYKNDRKNIYKLDILNGFLISMIPLILSLINKDLIKYAYLLASTVTFITFYFFYRLKIKSSSNDI